MAGSDQQLKDAIPDGKRGDDHDEQNDDEGFGEAGGAEAPGHLTCLF